MGFHYSNPIDFDALQRTLCLKASSEVSSNFTDSQYAKFKFFGRYTFPFKRASLQGSVSAGYNKPIGNYENLLKVNDHFYLKNFKGVRNLGYFYDPTNAKGISGENLGFDKYLNLNFKVF